MKSHALASYHGMAPIAMVLFLAVSLSPLLGATHNFDVDLPGQLPKGWESGTTGSGEPKWIIVEEKDAPSPPNVLKQAGSGTFPWCILTDSILQDGFAEVNFKALSGEEDQAAGLVWRFRNGDNYYVARANALENNVVLYKVENGKRSDLKPKGEGSLSYGVRTKIPAQAWNKLRVVFKGTRFEVYSNEKMLFEVVDSTFTEAGKVGVWTKADSITLFDDFNYGNEK